LWELQLQDGETIVSVTCGAGGYGPATEREPARVQADVMEGWITRERAANVYGVVLDQNGSVDLAATDAKRDGMSPGILTQSP
jgi:N-methylhydantoinase B